MRSKIEAATTWMENLAADNSHGYAWGGWGPQDYDCGHAIITAWEQAGVPVKSSGGASYTGDMRRAFLNCGFKDVTASINLKTGEGLRRGDVILNEAEHVVIDASLELAGLVEDSITLFPNSYCSANAN